MKKILSYTMVTVAVTIMFVACNKGAVALSDPTNVSPGPMQPYPKTVVVTVGVGSDGQTVGLKAGDSFENNDYTRALKEKLNIEYKVKWVATDYQQKLAIGMAAGDLPDVMGLSPYESLYNTMVKEHALAPLDAAYDKYLMDDIKNVYKNVDATVYKDSPRKVLDIARYKKQLYGLPASDVTINNSSLFWIRKDWLDNLKLAVPQSMTELEAVAIKFRDNDPDGNKKNDTVAIAAPYLWANMNGLYGANGTLAKQFLKDSSGKIYYGSVVPGAKDTLTLLARWYKEKLLDQDFLTRANTEELLVNGHAGIALAPWWSGYGFIFDNGQNDPKAEWIQLPFPKDKDGAIPLMVNINNGVTVVNAKYAHPEVIMQGANFSWENTFAPHNKAFIDSTEPDDRYIPLKALIYRDDLVTYYFQTITDLLARKANDDEVNKLPKELYTHYVSVKAGLMPDGSVRAKSSPAWGGAHSVMQSKIFLDNKLNYMHPVLYRTATMNSPQWAYLQKKEDEVFNKIIVGQLPMSAFDDFVKEWHEKGGDTVLKELTEAEKGN